MHSPKTQRAHNMRPNRKTLLPQFCQDQAECQNQQGQRVLRAGRAAQGRPVSQQASTAQVRQAVRSLGPLRYSCYQASTRGLATSSSRWDLDWLGPTSGKTPLGCGFALRCFQRLSLLDVAIQLCSRQSNWRTSGPAISVLSYWR
jgi:hypothetical protein